MGPNGNYMKELLKREEMRMRMIPVSLWITNISYFIKSIVVVVVAVAGWRSVCVCVCVCVERRTIKKWKKRVSIFHDFAAIFLFFSYYFPSTPIIFSALFFFKEPQWRNWLEGPATTTETDGHHSSRIVIQMSSWYFEWMPQWLIMHRVHCFFIQSLT